MKKQQSKRVIPGFGLTMGSDFGNAEYRSSDPSCVFDSILGAAGFSGIY